VATPIYGCGTKPLIKRREGEKELALRAGDLLKGEKKFFKRREEVKEVIEVKEVKHEK
jgi:hypothetical protein